MAMLRVGTSGWHYPHWKGVLYPVGLKTDAWLSFYAESFDTVEVNNSFYRLPSRETFSSWARSVPGDFIFAVKASRYITHRKKLKDPEEPLQRLMESAAGLGSKLGPILFQLPPRWNSNPERLRQFVKALPPGRRYAFEFRDPSWFNEEVYGILREGNCAFCVASSRNLPSVRQVTADFSFMRFHGGKLPGGKYSRDELKEAADFTSGLLSGGKDAYAYFNNDAHGYAVQNARDFRELLAE